VVEAVSAPLDLLPLTARLPDQPPDAVQLVALLAVQLRVAALPLVNVLGLAVRLTVGAGVLTETVAD
jgi:hypothetical protein